MIRFRHFRHLLETHKTDLAANAEQIDELRRASESLKNELAATKEQLLQYKTDFLPAAQKKLQQTEDLLKSVNDIRSDYIRLISFSFHKRELGRIRSGETRAASQPRRDCLNSRCAREGGSFSS